MPPVRRQHFKGASSVAARLLHTLGVVPDWRSLTGHLRLVLWLVSPRPQLLTGRAADAAFKCTTQRLRKSRRPRSVG